MGCGLRRVGWFVVMVVVVGMWLVDGRRCMVGGRSGRCVRRKWILVGEGRAGRLVMRSGWRRLRRFGCGLRLVWWT